MLFSLWGFGLFTFINPPPPLGKPKEFFHPPFGKNCFGRPWSQWKLFYAIFRWSNYYDTLEKFWLKMYFRSEEQGNDIYLRRYEHFPEYYRAANLKQGLWYTTVIVFIFLHYQDIFVCCNYARILSRKSSRVF